MGNGREMSKLKETREFRKGDVWLAKSFNGTIEEQKIVDTKKDYIKLRDRGWMEGEEFNKIAKTKIGTMRTFLGFYLPFWIKRT